MALDHAPAGAPADQLLAPLTITRAADHYAQWWVQTANHPAITEALEYVAEDVEVEHALHDLMVEVFQSSARAVGWLRVTGLRPDVGISYLCLDIDPAYDGAGMLVGVDVVLNLWIAAPGVSLTVATYTDRAREMLAPQSGTDPENALAEIIDSALAMVNRELADRDRFLAEARGVGYMAPHGKRAVTCRGQR